MDTGLRIGESYRFSSEEDASLADLQFVGPHKNWFFFTRSPREHDSSIRPQRGIWSPKSVSRPGITLQRPLIVCTTASHKAGSVDTPWTDIIRPDDGFAVYYGDNKPGKSETATSVVGNSMMLNAMWMQHAHDVTERRSAPPILIVAAHGEDGPGKGFRRVEGLAVIERADVIVQRDSSSGQTFSNMRFLLAVLDTSTDDNDMISWNWINARRDPTLQARDEWKLAPQVWQKFVNNGIPQLETLRRRVMRSFLVDTASQLPAAKSGLEDILLGTLSFYEHRKHEFEMLAAQLTQRLFHEQGLHYTPGWITSRSGDGGYDFVGRLDIDPHGMFPSSRQVILGQAKCERSSTSGRDIARLAARLRRGWQGVYVTTATFGRSVQQEVLEDKFPIILVPGARVATLLQRELDESGKTLLDYLSSVGNGTRIEGRQRDPETVLLEA